jgi:hypothetical protein
VTYRSIDPLCVAELALLGLNIMRINVAAPPGSGAGREIEAVKATLVLAPEPAANLRLFCKSQPFYAGRQHQAPKVTSNSVL